MDIVKNGFYWIINLLIQMLPTIVKFTLGLLPKIPFDIKPIEWGSFADFLGVFIPAKQIIIHFTALTMTLLTYYAARYLLKLIRMVG